MTSSYAYVKASIERRATWARTLKDKPCERCGQTDVPERMHWHHRDPSQKETRVSNAVFRMGRARILAEIEKCDLLCANCHDQVHEEQLPGHGTRASYVRGCRCDNCRAANARYARSVRARTVPSSGS